MEIRPPRDGEPEAAVRLFDRMIGDKLVALDEVADPGAYGVSLVAVRDSQLVGALTAVAVDVEDAASQCPVGQEGVLERIPGLRRHRGVAHLRDVAVASEDQRRGIGSELVARALPELRRRGASMVFSFGWTPPDGCHVAGALRRNRFAEHARVEEFYLADSERYGYRCPADGNPCRCAATVFSRTL